MKKTILLFFLVLLGFAADALAQEWVQTGGPGGGFNQIAFNSKKDMFLSAGTLMRSTDGGKTWTKIAPSDAPERATWTTAISPNQYIYITGASRDSSRLWNSTDNGITWKRIWLNNPNSLLCGQGNSIYAESGDEFNRSTDFGKTWKNIRQGNFIDHSIDSNGVIILSVESAEDSIYFFRSSDSGLSWFPFYLYAIWEIQPHIACGKKGNIFVSSMNASLSSDDGISWAVLPNLELDRSRYWGTDYLITNHFGRILFYNGSSLNTSSLNYSEDNGITWKDFVPKGKQLDSASSLSSDADSGFYFMFNKKPIHEYNPDNWQEVNFPTSAVVGMIAASDGSIFASTESSLWHSDSSQSKWQFVQDLIANVPAQLVIDSNKNILYIEYRDLFRSSDIGKTWKEIPMDVEGGITSAVVHPNGIVFAASDYSGIYKSADSGSTWDFIGDLSQHYYPAIAVSPQGNLYALGGDIDDIFISDDTGKTWSRHAQYNGGPRCMITDRYGNLFASFNSLVKAATYRSTDEGKTWTLFNNGLACTNVNSMIELADGSIAAATDSGVFILPLEGCEWIAYSSGLWTKNLPSIACSKSGELYAGSDGCGVFKSTKLFNDTLKLTGVIDPGGSIDYKTIQTGSTSCQYVVLKNRGLKPFTIQSYTVVDPTPFSLSDASAKKIPITLNPKDSITMTICFHPPQPAVYTSSIIWNTDIDPSLCGISRETELRGVAITKSFVSNSNSSDLTFSLHSNPVSSNSVTITFSDALSQPAALSVYDVLGREVYRNHVTPGSKEFDIPIRDLSEGTYYVRIELDGKIVSKQFIKVE